MISRTEFAQYLTFSLHPYACRVCNELIILLCVRPTGEQTSMQNFKDSFISKTPSEKRKAVTCEIVRQEKAQRGILHTTYFSICLSRTKLKSLLPFTVSLRNPISSWLGKSVWHQTQARKSLNSNINCDFVSPLPSGIPGWLVQPQHTPGARFREMFSVTEHGSTEDTRYSLQRWTAPWQNEWRAQWSSLLVALGGTPPSWLTAMCLV